MKNGGFKKYTELKESYVIKLNTKPAVELDKILAQKPKDGASIQATSKKWNNAKVKCFILKLKLSKGLNKFESDH